MTQYTHCVLCNTEANEPFNNHGKGFHYIDCPVCGKYEITIEALLDLPGNLAPDQKRTLSEYVRSVSDQGSNEIVTLSTEGPNGYQNILERLKSK